MFLFQKRLTKKQRLFAKRANAILRKRCPKGVYKLLFGRDSLRKTYELIAVDDATLGAAFALLPTLMTGRTQQ